MHRLEKYWGKDFSLLDPERWIDDRKKDIKAYSFLPFHGGPQLCLG